MSGRPMVEVLSDGHDSAGFAALVIDLAHVCRPVAGDPWTEATAPVATVAASPRATGLGSAIQAGRPVALWVSQDDLAAGGPAVDAATVLLSAEPLDDRGPTVRHVAVPPNGVDVDRWPATMPFVRARRRRGRGLPDELVIDAVALAGTSDAASLLPCALPVASAAIVDERWALPALALATPVITDEVTAMAIGAQDGVHVVVAPRDAQAAAASDLGADERRAARLARAGRRLVEHDHDRGAAVRQIAGALGLAPRAHGPRPLLAARLHELVVAPA